MSEFVLSKILKIPKKEWIRAIVIQSIFLPTCIFSIHILDQAKHKRDPVIEKLFEDYAKCTKIHGKDHLHCKDINDDLDYHVFFK